MDFILIPWPYADEGLSIPMPIVMLKRIRRFPTIYGKTSSTLIPTLIKRINALYETGR